MVRKMEPEEATIARQRLGKQVSEATDTEATIEELLGTMFSIRSVESGNKQKVQLRIAVGGDEKGSLKSETVKYGNKSQGTGTRERLRWQRPAAYTKNRPVLSSEWAPHRNKIETVKQ
jgi:hypothetical protein